MRPGYVQEVYDDLFHLISFGPESNVTETGIGGGQAAKPVPDPGCMLNAIEFGEQLAELCRGKAKDCSKDYDMLKSGSVFARFANHLYKDMQYINFIVL